MTTNTLTIGRTTYTLVARHDGHMKHHLTANRSEFFTIETVQQPGVYELRKVSTGCPVTHTVATAPNPYCVGLSVLLVENDGSLAAVRPRLTPNKVGVPHRTQPNKSRVRAQSSRDSFENGL